MALQTYFVNNKYFVIDDETGKLMEGIPDENPNLSVDELKKLVALMATGKREWKD
jgi:hypothetical protein